MILLGECKVKRWLNQSQTLGSLKQFEWLLCNSVPSLFHSYPLRILVPLWSLLAATIGRNCCCLEAPLFRGKHWVHTFLYHRDTVINLEDDLVVAGGEHSKRPSGRNVHSGHVEYQHPFSVYGNISSILCTSFAYPCPHLCRLHTRILA